MISSREGDGRTAEAVHRLIVGVVRRAPERGVLGEAALGAIDVPAPELDVTEVVKLDADHPLVAEPPVQGQALLQEGGRFGRGAATSSSG